MGNFNSKSEDQQDQPLEGIDGDFWRTGENTFVWCIKDFSQQIESNSDGRSYIPSYTFTVNDSDGRKTYWNLLLYPKGYAAPENNLAVYVESFLNSDLQGRFELSILDSKDNTRKPSVRAYKAWPVGNEGDHWSSPKFISLDDLKSKELLPNDTLTLAFKLCIKGEEEVTSGINETRTPDKDHGHKRLLEELEQSFLTMTLSDCKIVCGEEEFEAHQFMLAARSPVFRAMFSNKLSEATTKKVNIPDLTPTVVGEMLRYIYTGSALNLAESADELLVAADKYQLDSLKSVSELELTNNINMENAINHFILGDMHQAQGLKEASLAFLVRNWSAISKSKDWKNKMLDKPDLLAQVLEKMG